MPREGAEHPAPEAQRHLVPGRRGLEEPSSQEKGWEQHPPARKGACSTTLQAGKGHKAACALGKGLSSHQPREKV